MKLTIKQDVLMGALKIGAVPAISDTAQLDTSNLSLIIQSVKITVGKKFIVESNTNLMAVKYSIDATPENGIDVKKEGSALIPAKEFLDWVKIQGNESTIGMDLNILSTPEIINPMDDLGVSNDNNRFSIKKIGSMRFASKDTTKTSGKWELDCYDPEQVKSVNFSKKGNKHFDIKAEDLVKSINKVLFVSLDKDVDHVLDHISIQTYNDQLYLATTDTKRCAIFKVPIMGDIVNTDSLLIPAKLLESVSKISIKENTLGIYYNNELGRIFIQQPNIDIRIASGEKDNIAKFPGIEMLFQKPYKELSNISKNAFNKILISASLVNNLVALFTFNKEKNIIDIKAISEEGRYKPSVSKAEAKTINEDVKGIWGVSHLTEVLKHIKGNTVLLHIPDNKKSIKITEPEDDNFQYFALSIPSSVYQNK